MKELFIIVAKSMPEEILLDKLSEALQAYKLFNKEEDKKSIMLYTNLITLKWTSADQSVTETIADMDKCQKAMDLLSPKSN